MAQFPSQDTTYSIYGIKSLNLSLDDKTKCHHISARSRRRSHPPSHRNPNCPRRDRVLNGRICSLKRKYTRNYWTIITIRSRKRVDTNSNISGGIWVRSLAEWMKFICGDWNACDEIVLELLRLIARLHDNASRGVTCNSNCSWGV